jgi:spermidine synthase
MDLTLLSLTEAVETTQTEFQTVQVADSEAYGRLVLTDHFVQSCASDERIYHESLIHVPCQIHGDVKRVLIGGAGEGATLRELLRYESVQEIITVDIDGKAVECFQKYLFEWERGLWHHEKVRIVINDINEVLPLYHSYFDLLILDLSDPAASGPVAHLFTDEFYVRCRNCLRPGGIMAMQSGEVTDDMRVPRSVRATLSEVFEHTDFFTIDVPSFMAPLMISLASESAFSMVPEDLAERTLRICTSSPGDPGPLHFYSLDVHLALVERRRLLQEVSRHALIHPNFVEKLWQCR